jgi:hypothetical protein
MRETTWAARCDGLTLIIAASGGSDAVPSSVAARRLTGSITTRPMSDGAKRCTQNEATDRLLDVSMRRICA